MTFDFFEAFKHYPGLQCHYLYSFFLHIRTRSNDLESLVKLYDAIAINIDDFSKLTPLQRQEFQSFLEISVTEVNQRLIEINRRQSLLNEDDSEFQDCEFELDDANEAKHNYEHWLQQLNC